MLLKMVAHHLSHLLRFVDNPSLLNYFIGTDAGVGKMGSNGNRIHTRRLCRFDSIY